MKLLICFGTRPEYIKIKPLFSSLQCSYDICFIEQHKDLIIDENVHLRIPIVEMSENRLNSVIGSILCAKIPWENYSHVLVQGDTASAFAIALSAFNNRVKIIHLEAGLRTYDRFHPYPEESYRCMISRITDIHLCPGPHSVKNLLRENVGGIIHNVGNTVIDNLFKTIKDNAIEVLAAEKCRRVVITLHRRENWGSLHDLFLKIEGLAKEYCEAEFLFIKHPNPELHKMIEQYMPSVKCLPPQSYLDCVRLICESRCIITDSGGIQEEAAAVGRRILVLREATERSELLEKHVILCNDTLVETFKEVYLEPSIEASTVYGTGNSSTLINEIMMKMD